MAATRTTKRSSALPERETVSALSDLGGSALGKGAEGASSNEEGSSSAYYDSSWGTSTENFSWEDWGRRSEAHWVKVARTMETAIWFSIGAMLGTFAGGIPGTMIPNYAFFIWQPLGAATGALLALWLLKRGERPYRPSFRVRRFK